MSLGIIRQLEDQAQLLADALNTGDDDAAEEAQAQIDRLTELLINED